MSAVESIWTPGVDIQPLEGEALDALNSAASLATEREAILPVYTYLNKYRNQFGYTEGSERMMMCGYTWPQMQTRLAAGDDVTGDCSASIIAGSKYAGWDDPSGNGYDGLGFTGSFVNYLPEISQSSVHLGSIGVYGPDSGVHGIQALGNFTGDSTPVWSHGVAFAGITTLGAINAGLASYGLRWFAIQHLLPPIEPSYHYGWFDDTILKSINNSERGVVENYDKYRKLSAGDPHLGLIKQHLGVLVDRLEKIMNESDPRGAQFHRAWRLLQMTERIDGKEVSPTI